MATATVLTESISANGGGPARLRRHLGLAGLTAVSLGSVIGSGWLFGTLTAAGYAGAASLVSWALAAFMLAFIALMYAELGAAYPVSGGTARYSFLAFGPLGGFAAGWMSWLQAVTIAPIETKIALSYLQPKWPGVFDTTTSLLTGKGVGFAVLFILFFTLLNLAGLRWMAGFNQVVVWVKAAVPVAVVVALAVTRFHFGNFDAGGGFAPFGFQGIFKAIPGGVVFALIGFEQAVQVGGEARNPQRDLPRAVVASLVIGTLLYLALQAVLIGSLDPHTLTSSAGWANPLGAVSHYGPFAQLATAAGLGWLATVIYFDAVISPAGRGMLYVSTTSRITYSMGKSRTLPGIFERLDRRGTPWFSVILASAFGVVVFLPFGGWSRLVHFISTATAFMYAFAPVSLAALRRSDRDRWRPYEVPAASVLAPLAFVSANLIVYWGGWPTAWRFSLGLAIGAILVLVARILTPKPRRQPLEWRAAVWVVPWLAGILVLDAIGPSYVNSVSHVIGFWWDLGVVAIFSLGIFYLAQWLSLMPGAVAENVAAAQMAAPDSDIELGVGD
jgi:amino acid transporter